MKVCSIRELSDLAGVSARTLRYYDEIGLLKPLYVSEAGYRYYGEKEVLLLQQILFYKERGFDLKEIKQIIYQKDFDIMGALENHLQVLEKQRNHVDTLIRTVKLTISQMRGERSMNNMEKFKVFRENLVKENEENFGKEIRGKYGDEEADAVNSRLLHMSEADYERFKSLETEIKIRLEEAVQTGAGPESKESEQIVNLHREWLSMTWRKYTKEAHTGVAAMYTCDDRFKKYYDENVSGCAAFLERAVKYWV